MLNYNRLLDGDISLEDLPSPITQEEEPIDQDQVKKEVNQEGDK
jgi:hypothetical protein